MVGNYFEIEMEVGNKPWSDDKILIYDISKRLTYPSELAMNHCFCCIMALSWINSDFDLFIDNKCVST